MINPTILEEQQHELASLIRRFVAHDGTQQIIDGLYLQRVSQPSGPIYGVSQPSLCVIAQGSKQVFLGNECFQYDPAHYLITSLDLPVVGQITCATPEQAYLSLRLRLDPALVQAVLIEAQLDLAINHEQPKAIGVSTLNRSLIDACIRLVRLGDSPDSASFLAPLILREIIYYLLTGDQAARLRQIASLGADAQQIGKVIQQVRNNVQQPLRAEALAHELGMSVSSMYQQFKAVTAMSPLQFQKRLRLQEARRLMLSEGLDAASAGLQVGYYDPSHFSREYKSLFGLPPIRDIEYLRKTSRS